MLNIRNDLVWNRPSPFNKEKLHNLRRKFRPYKCSLNKLLKHLNISNKGLIFRTYSLFKQALPPKA